MKRIKSAGEARAGLRIDICFVAIRQLRLGLLLVLLGMILSGTSTVWGQAFVNGRVAGTVIDNSGGVVPGATMTLTSLGTNVKRTTETNSSGMYEFLNIPPANYRVEAEKSGFKRFSREPIVVEVNNVVRIDPTLQVGSQTETVTVTARTPLLQPQTSSLGQVVTARAAETLPLNGRNPMALVALVPGVVPQGGYGQNMAGQNPFAVGNIQINGGTANQSAAYWDGAPLNASGYVNSVALTPTQDALQEFKVQTNNMSAEYDRFSGGIINFTSKTGTNRLHGTLYEFLRNKDLNANDFFSNRSGGHTGAFTQNQFGGNIGGPVFLPHLYDGRDKTFFFATYDGFRLRRGVPLLLTVPPLDQRNGDFTNLRDSAGNVIPIYDPSTTRLVNGAYVRDQYSCNGVLNVICPDKIDPAAKALLMLWGAPNQPGTPNTQLNNWAGNVSSASYNNQAGGRVDHNISEKQRLFMRYSHMWLGNPAADVFNNKAIYVNTAQYQTAHQAVINDSYSFSPTTISDISITYMRATYQVKPNSLGFDLSQLGPGWAQLNSQVVFRTQPALAIVGMNAPGASGQGIFEATDDYGLLPNLTMVRGRHTIKVGGDFRLARFNYLQANFASGIFVFGPGNTSSSPLVAGGSAFASYMTGNVAAGWFDNPRPISAQQIYRAGYVQDDFRVSRKLTVNLGLRYSQGGPFSERFDAISVFQGNAPSPVTWAGHDLVGRLALVNTPDRPSRTGWDMNTHMFAPRIGFAYQLTPSTVIRGGYGLFWLPETAAWGATNPAVDPINWYSPVMTSTIDGVTPYRYFGNPIPEGLTPAPGHSDRFQSVLIGQALTNQVPDNPYGYTQQWNLDLQRQLPGGIFLDVAYSGSKGTHLPFVGMQMDQLPPQYMSMGTGLNTLVDNPFYGQITSGALAAAKVTQGQLLRPFPQYNGVAISGAGAGLSSYHSLQMKVQKQFTSGQTLLVAYTNSKLITTTGGITNWLEGVTSGGTSGVQNWYNYDGERTLSDFDVPQRLVISYVLDMPFGRGKKYLSGVHGPIGKLISGWAINGVTSVQSGFPLHLGTAANLTGSYGGGSRPNYNPNGAGCAQSAAFTGRAEDRLNKWFNTACFSQPPAYTFGNVARALPNVRSDGIQNFDFAVFKTTTFGPDNRLGLQFRAEFFNLLNHPQFGVPGLTLNTGAFGLVSSQANTPRLIQFALRFMF